MSLHHIDCDNDMARLQRKKHSDKTRSTVTMDDVDFSFFLLFLPAVGIDELQQL
jgi:hypothetical protein